MTTDVFVSPGLTEVVTVQSGSYYINHETLSLDASGYLRATYLFSSALEARVAGTLWVLGSAILGTATTPTYF